MESSGSSDLAIDNISASGPSNGTTASTGPNSTVCSKLETLLDIFIQKLTTNTYGSWCFEGERTAVPGRTIQLSEAFEIKQLLEQNLASLKSRAQVPTEKSVMEGRKAGKFTSAQEAAIRTAVQEEM